MFSIIIYWQKSASIQPRTSPVKFARSPCTDPPGTSGMWQGSRTEWLARRAKTGVKGRGVAFSHSTRKALLDFVGEQTRHTKVKVADRYVGCVTCPVDVFKHFLANDEHFCSRNTSRGSVEDRSLFMDRVQDAIAELGNWYLVMSYLGVELEKCLPMEGVTFLPANERQTGTAHKTYCNLVEALIGALIAPAPLHERIDADDDDGYADDDDGYQKPSQKASLKNAARLKKMLAFFIVLMLFDDPNIMERNPPTHHAKAAEDHMCRDSRNVPLTVLAPFQSEHRRIKEEVKNFLENESVLDNAPRGSGRILKLLFSARRKPKGSGRILEAMKRSSAGSHEE